MGGKLHFVRFNCIFALSKYRLTSSSPIRGTKLRECTSSKYFLHIVPHNALFHCSAENSTASDGRQVHFSDYYKQEKKKSPCFRHPIDHERQQSNTTNRWTRQNNYPRVTSRLHLPLSEIKPKKS